MVKAILFLIISPQVNSVKESYFITHSLLTTLNPLAPMSDQDRLSPYNVNTISTRQVMRIKKTINFLDNSLIQY